MNTDKSHVINELTCKGIWCRKACKPTEYGRNIQAVTALLVLWLTSSLTFMFSHYLLFVHVSHASLQSLMYMAHFAHCMKTKFDSILTNKSVLDAYIIFWRLLNSWCFVWTKHRVLTTVRCGWWTKFGEDAHAQHRCWVQKQLSLPQKSSAKFITINARMFLRSKFWNKINF